MAISTQLSMKVKPQGWMGSAVDKLYFLTPELLELFRARISDTVRNGSDNGAARMMANALYAEKLFYERTLQEASQQSLTVSQTIDSLDDNSQRQAIYSLLGQLTGSPMDDNPAQLSSPATDAATEPAE